MAQPHHDSIDGVVAGMQERLDALSPGQEHRREFLGTYQRTTIAVGKAVRDGVFEDGPWVEEWDVAFANLYLDALDADLGGGRVPRPWRLAFEAPPDLKPLQHVLLGINAHINYDLPQALLAVISDEEFSDPTIVESRRRDHERIDGVLSGRVSAEDQELAAVSARSLLDRVLTPLNQLASKRFLREARQKVWHNTGELQQARLAGPDAYAVAGFGVLLPPPSE
jgi:uncharacterized protein DUF5995